MSYKSILVHVDNSDTVSERVAVAARLASEQDAHLIGAAATGVLSEYYRNSAMMYAGMVPQDQIDDLTRSAEQALDRFEAQASAAGTRYERRISDDAAQDGLVLQARYADLVVLSQSEPGDEGLLLGPGLAAYLALYGGRPVLVVPYVGKYPHIDRHALVAWDGSRAATRAVTDALPLLRRSARVTLAVFDPKRQYGVHGAEPGADIALFLARHGVKVEVLQQPKPEGMNVGEALLSLSADLGADLLVMGAYGHLRWREMVLGGVTRTLLESMTLPVLMSH
ncbi:universal stress protein [Duganella sp. HH101]|uniref:universal stress protein n=1 Tax=Duganella sp. HH101 TaxID=1781066 RepID=UPI000874D064|nr:universal stress protein [Duganella sp. HH101]OFA03643.1 universal stress protein family protein [Duganella sp. HH101]